MRPITHVIYDLDGLLLDTERLYTAATREVVRRYGKEYEWSLKARMIGRRARDSAQILTEALALPITPEEYLEARMPILERLFPEAEPLPGALRLTRHLDACGIPQAVATSSERKSYDLKTAHHRDWMSLFGSVVTGDDPEVRHGKPAPDIFLVAAERLDAAPNACLVFEDSPFGVEAARAAGMAVIAVPDPAMAREAFAEADLVLDSLLDFDPIPWSLPAFAEKD